MKNLNPSFKISLSFFKARQLKTRELAALILLTYGLILNFVPSQSWATNEKPSCPALLSSHVAAHEDRTAALIAYLNDLIDHQIIGDSEIVKMFESLEKGLLINPIDEEKTWVDSAALIHRPAIDEYLKSQTLDHKRLLDWAEGALKEKSRVQARRDENKSETKSVIKKIEFLPVAGGAFEMGYVNDKVSVTLTHPFEMMTTQVTQAQWVELMGENPSHFVEGQTSLVTLINGKSIKMQPDHPVERVSWYAAIVFANRLSAKMGYAPAYDLSTMAAVEGSSAEAGSLDFLKNDVKINAPSGEIYLAEGYRLPTEAEFEFMLRAGGQAKERFYFGENEGDLKDYAWCGRHTGATTHPVAELGPMVLDGKSFYDLFGNVQEWVHDGHSIRKGGDDPSGDSYLRFHVTRGGSWATSEKDMGASHRYSANSGSKDCDTGFRLVRTLRPLAPGAAAK